MLIFYAGSGTKSGKIISEGVDLPRCSCSLHFLRYFPALQCSSYFPTCYFNLPYFPQQHDSFALSLMVLEQSGGQRPCKFAFLHAITAITLQTCRVGIVALQACRWGPCFCPLFGSRTCCVPHWPDGEMTSFSNCSTKVEYSTIVTELQALTLC